MKKILSFVFSFIFIALMVSLTSCGPSAEQRRQQEIEDSIQLEKERREALNRASRIFETPAENNDQVADGDTL